MKICLQNLVVALALLAGIHQATAQTSFLLSSNYTVGTVGCQPSSVAVFKNVNGKLDMVCANNGGTLTLLTNNGSGIFATNAIYAAGSGSGHVIVFTNVDGRINLVCANTYDSTLSIYTNNGSGGFVLNSNMVAGIVNSFPDSVAAADVNYDGKIDLICVNGNPSKLEVFTNSGSGGFLVSGNYATGSGPHTVVVADVNNDGKLDLMCINTGDTVSVLTNNGIGIFAPSHSDYPSGGSSAVEGFAVADVNGDGYVDLITANTGAGSISVLTNNGNGTFAISVTNFIGNTTSIAAFTNVDGKVDLVCGVGNQIIVLTNNGSGIFTPACTNIVGNYPYITAADVNGDGKVDLICANSGSNTVSVLFNTSTFITIPFTYTTNSGAITITGYTGTGGAVTIPNAINGYPVTSIGNTAFQSSSVTNVTFGNNVTNIAYGAFAACYSLTSVTFGNSVTTIGYVAFASCTSLTTVTIPSSVTSIGADAFWGCTSLTNIAVAIGNPNYSSLNGVLFDKNYVTLLEFPGGLAGSYTVPNSATTIGSDAFLDCSSLTSVTIGNSVTSIGDSAFMDCIGLTNVTIPSSVTSIGSSVFFNCPKLTSVTIPNSVTSIGSSAFQNCSGLTNVTIGINVTTIGSYAFDYCTSLKSVYFQGNAPSPTNDTTVFLGVSTATAYYLSGTTGWGATFDGIPTSAILIPPAVAISTYGNQPAVFFPTATGTNFVLQMTTNLTQPVNWVTVSNGVPISGIIVTNPAANAFFRLH